MSCAIPEIKDYNTWTPQTEHTLDLRMLIPTDSTDTMSIRYKVDEAFKNMQGNLEALYTQAFCGTKETYETLVNCCPNVKVLNLHCAKGINNEILKKISTLPKLEELNVAFCDAITDEGIEPILKNCPIKKLDLSGSKITSKTLEILKDIKEFKYLKLEGWEPEGSDDTREVISLDMMMVQLRFDYQIKNLSQARSDITIATDKSITNVIYPDARREFISLFNNVKDRYHQDQCLQITNLFPYIENYKPLDVKFVNTRLFSLPAIFMYNKN